MGRPTGHRRSRRGTRVVGDPGTLREPQRARVVGRNSLLKSSLLDHGKLEVTLDDLVAVNVADALHLHEAEAPAGRGSGIEWARVGARARARARACARRAAPAPQGGICQAQ